MPAVLNAVEVRTAMFVENCDLAIRNGACWEVIGDMAQLGRAPRVVVARRR